ncbi:MAG: septum formation initiator family protein [Muribaculaceae bacterium]|jgi:cell division protein FtsB|nr:septum formation initiator family protein [Muribaculaceae bacterium]MCI9117717.1 septum formation initiator family protein [Muribaculaceae bacterium]
MNDESPRKGPASRKATAWMQRYMSLPTVAVLAILVYIVFFGESSVTQRIEYQRQIDSLSAEVAVVQDSVDYYRELNRRLASEPEAMERVVREQYNMKREHEDVFVLE